MPGKFVGLANFQELIHDEMFWIGLRNSTLYVVGVVPALVLLPLLLAMLVQRNIPGITFFRSAFYTPVVASIVVVGLIWVWMLDDRGLVNAVLEAVGIGRVGFLSDQWLLLLSAMTVTVWKGLGYYMIIYLAALANVPRELHEAASVDGAACRPPVLHRDRSRRPLHHGPRRGAGVGRRLQGVLRGLSDGRSLRRPGR